MEKIVYISTLGINKKEKRANLDPIIAALRGIRLDRIYKFYFLTEKYESTIKSEIESHFFFPKDTVNYLIIDPFDYESVLNSVLEIHSLHKDLKVDFIVNVTGGTKVMSLGAFMGANLIGARIQYIKAPDKFNHNLNERNTFIDIEMPSVPISDITNVQKVILFVLNSNMKNKKKPEILNQSELAVEINEPKWRKYWRDSKTTKMKGQNLSYHVKKLEKHKLLIRSHNVEDNRAFELRLTRMGTILANYLIRT
ncbi:DUF6293 family protein [Promethearchaeum syntrophicum]|uniref:DUF6293 family protein n=1 Tax=Promethearchaeum syntrophicum TaxID=2594042 RepID=A0A5B9D687_9ARCH|nr:DUF6293 family protein [Candidatus Prometheoarchaeum syntrophicum]QEE14496.1 CRISPR-associated protein (Cas_Cas02710) [Candidatus Prometheoarchaeum syntrophicum]